MNDDLDTEDLNRVLVGRADRARPAGDPVDVVADVIALAGHRTRARRNRLAVAGGAAIVVAIATVGIAIAGTGGATAHHPSSHPAGNGVVDSVPVHPSSSRVTELPKISPLLTKRAERKRAEMLRAQQAARRELERARQAHRAQLAHPTLVHVDPAPKQAEISIGYVPPGFRYLSHDDANTYYGPAGLPQGDYFSKSIVVDVHVTVPGTKFPLLIDGMPGSYIKSGGYTIVRVEYSKKVDIGFQAPPNATLTRAQALTIASTFDVRSTKHKTKG